MAGGKVTSPTGTAPDRYVYYPGTEELGADEMRVIACGTGMPTARRSQAAASWVVELGNGVCGIEEASQYYFKKSASELSKSEPALIAATLPSPRS